MLTRANPEGAGWVGVVAGPATTASGALAVTIRRDIAFGMLLSVVGLAHLVVSALQLLRPRDPGSGEPRPRPENPLWNVATGPSEVTLSGDQDLQMPALSAPIG